MWLSTSFKQGAYHTYSTKVIDQEKTTTQQQQLNQSINKLMNKLKNEEVKWNETLTL